MHVFFNEEKNRQPFAIFYVISHELVKVCERKSRNVGRKHGSVVRTGLCSN